MSPLSIAIAGFLLLLVPGVMAQESLVAELDSAFLVKGESTRLTLEAVGDTLPAEPPSFLPNPDLSIKFFQEGLRILPGRRRSFRYTYLLQSFTEGTHEVPSFRLSIGGKTLESLPLRVRIAPVSELTFGTLEVANREVKYYSAVFVPDIAPYQGETFPAEVKVYLPETTGSGNPGMAELEHPGLVAWRFEPVLETNRVTLPTGNHVGLTFQSTASPIRNGEVTLGPGHARIVLRVRSLLRGFTHWDDVPTQFAVPARTLTARPLPSGAPAAFSGAVGRFAIRVSADTDELEEGDPIAIRLAVTGRGNLDTLPAPTLDAPAGEWKTYEPSRLERQGERRAVTGEVRFSQIIRPLATQQEVPAFQLVFFDPEEARYETVRTSPIPFTMRPGKKRSPAVVVTPTLATPVEDMQGILGLVDPLRSSSASAGSSWLRYWQLLPAILGLFLLYRLARRHLFPRFQKSERERQVMASLQLVEQSDPDARSFLRASGHFIERWIPPAERSDELRELIEERDTDCYRPNHQDLVMDQARRSRILGSLKSVALNAGRTAVLAAILLGGQSFGAQPELSAEQLYRQAELAWSEGNYRVTIDLYTQALTDAPSADLLYNLGNCHYQLGEPGLAALHYHRALLRNPRHAEAKQNLRFLERTLGSITVLRPPYQDFLARIDRRHYLTAMCACLWTVALSGLGYFSLSSRLGRILVWTGLIGGSLAAIPIGFGHALYPDSAEFAPVEQQAIITSPERIEARTEASSAGNRVIDAPPGSLCRLLARRGAWSYVEFANLTRGWLPSSQVTRLVPPAGESQERL